jgi:hypothetical protein
MGPAGSALGRRVEPRLGQLDQPTTFPRSNRGNDGLGNARWLQPVEHDADDARGPTGGVPLQLDRNKAVPGKQRRADLDLAAR